MTNCGELDRVPDVFLFGGGDWYFRHLYNIFKEFYIIGRGAYNKYVIKT